MKLRIVSVIIRREGLVDVINGKKKDKLYVYLFSDVILFTKAKVDRALPLLISMGLLIRRHCTSGEDAGARFEQTQVQTQRYAVFEGLDVVPSRMPGVCVD